MHCLKSKKNTKFNVMVNLVFCQENGKETDKLQPPLCKVS